MQSNTAQRLGFDPRINDIRVETARPIARDFIDDLRSKNDNSTAGFITSRLSANQLLNIDALPPMERQKLEISLMWIGKDAGLWDTGYSGQSYDIKAVWKFLLEQKRRNKRFMEQLARLAAEYLTEYESTMHAMTHAQVSLAEARARIEAELLAIERENQILAQHRTLGTRDAEHYDEWQEDINARKKKLLAEQQALDEYEQEIQRQESLISSRPPPSVSALERTRGDMESIIDTAAQIGNVISKTAERSFNVVSGAFDAGKGIATGTRNAYNVLKDTIRWRGAPQPSNDD